MGIYLLIGGILDGTGGPDHRGPAADGQCRLSDQDHLRGMLGLVGGYMFLERLQGLRAASVRKPTQVGQPRDSICARLIRPDLPANDVFRMFVNLKSSQGLCGETSGVILYAPGQIGLNHAHIGALLHFEDGTVMLKGIAQPAQNLIITDGRRVDRHPPVQLPCLLKKVDGLFEVVAALIQQEILFVAPYFE